MNMIYTYVINRYIYSYIHPNQSVQCHSCMFSGLTVCYWQTSQEHVSHPQPSSAACGSLCRVRPGLPRPLWHACYCFSFQLIFGQPCWWDYGCRFWQSQETQSHSHLPDPRALAVLLPPLLQCSPSLGYRSYFVDLSIRTGLIFFNSSFWLAVAFCNGLHPLRGEVSLMRDMNRIYIWRSGARCLWWERTPDVNLSGTGLPHSVWSFIVPPVTGLDPGEGWERAGWVERLDAEQQISAGAGKVVPVGATLSSFLGRHLGYLLPGLYKCCYDHSYKVL